jgi:hypothetical protein
MATDLQGVIRTPARHESWSAAGQALLLDIAGLVLEPCADITELLTHHTYR